METEHTTEVTPADAPQDEREYILWHALQLVPYPRYHGDGFANLYGKPIAWGDIDWHRDYGRWYHGQRLAAMKNTVPGPMVKQLMSMQQENEQLRELLRRAREALDNTRIIQDIDDCLGSLVEDIDY